PFARGPTGAPHALISKADRQIDLDVTGFETIPDIESEEWQHDRAQIEARSDADRVLQRREQVMPPRVARGQVIALVVRAVAGRAVPARHVREVAGVPEPEAAHRQIPR